MRLSSLFIIALLLVTTQQIHAQIKRGMVSVGLTLNMQFSNNEAFSSTLTNTYFSLGTLFTAESFVKDNFSIIGGLEWDYGNQHTVYNELNNLNIPYTDDIRALSNIYAPTLGIRKYWFHPGGRLGLFASPMVQVRYRVVNTIKTTTDPNVLPDNREQEQKKETWVFGFTGDIGLCYFIVPHLTLELSAPLIQATAQKNYQNAFITSTLNNISYGVRYYF